MGRFLIIGGGLSGISLAESILLTGREVVVIDDRSRPSSTGVATGMFHPIVFRHVHQSWMAEELIAYLHPFYDRISDKLGVTLKESIDFEKVIPNAEYANLWESRRLEPPFDRYLQPISNQRGRVMEAGMLNCSLLVESYLDYLYQNGILKDEAFNREAFMATGDGIRYNEEKFDAAIFCDGPYGATNPFFSWLPFNICQGEWIIVKSEARLCDRVINKVHNIIPLGEDTYKISSTFSWDSLDWKPTPKARQTLLETFHSLFEADAEVIDHQAGLRPTVADRRPYLGAHPEHPNVYTLNGLGSKGVMLAPYFARHLVEHILEGIPLIPEVDIARHTKRYERMRDQNQ